MNSASEISRPKLQLALSITDNTSVCKVLWNHRLSPWKSDGFFVIAGAAARAIDVPGLRARRAAAMGGEGSRGGGLAQLGCKFRDDRSWGRDGRRSCDALGCAGRHLSRRGAWRMATSDGAGYGESRFDWRQRPGFRGLPRDGKTARARYADGCETGTRPRLDLVKAGPPD